MTWSSSLAQQAQDWADNIAPRGSMQHSSGDYGENIYMMGGFDSTTPTPCAMAVYSWYRECINANYNYNQPFTAQTGGVTGHFTQVVWKESTEVGCGIALGGTDRYIVCQYRKAGNMNYLGNASKTQSMVGQVKSGAKQPGNPSALMAQCKNMYSDYCPIFSSNDCAASWGVDFGPSTMCPVTCNTCE